jgi:hypothetical protein
MQQEPKKKKTLTFGEFVAKVREAYDQNEGRKIVKYAVNKRMIVFRAHPRVVVGP